MKNSEKYKTVMAEPNYIIVSRTPFHADYWAVATIYDPVLGFYVGSSEAGDRVFCISFNCAKKFDNFKDGVHSVDCAIDLARHLGHGAECRVYKRCEVYLGQYGGYCDEFPMAGLINENCCCEGKVTPFKRKEVRDGGQH